MATTKAAAPEEERIRRWTRPSAAALAKGLEIELEVATKINAVLLRRVEPEAVSHACATWVRQCHNMPSWHERALEACNELLGGHGVEGLTIDNDPNTHEDSGVRMCPAFSYVNMGDTYSLTLLRDHDEQAWILSDWASVMEEYEAENVTEDEDDLDDADEDDESEDDNEEEVSSD